MIDERHPREGSPVLENLLADALRHHESGRLNEAEGLYRQILRVDPQHADALHLLGVIAHQVGQLDIAVMLINRAIAIRPDDASACCNLGNALKDLGRLDKAVAAYSAAILADPHLQEAHYNLGNTLWDLRRFPDAAASYRAALRIRPDDADARTGLGNALREMGCLEEAVICYGAVLRGKQDCGDAYYNLGNTLLDLGRIDVAVSAYVAALCLKPDNPEIHANLGTALKSLGNIGAAVDRYHVALRIKPDNARAYGNLGAARYGQGNLEGAMALSRAALCLKPDFDGAHYNLANALVGLQHPNDAIIAYGAALHINPIMVEALCNLGVALTDLGRLDEAVAVCEATIGIKPGYAEAYSNLGVVRRDLGRLDEAVTACKAALRIKPDYAEAYSNLGNTLRDQGRLELAIAAYRSALGVKPDCAEALYNLGNALRDQGRRDDAIIAYSAAIRVKPGYAEALSQMVHQLMHHCAWEELADRQQQVLDLVHRHRGGIAPFTLIALPLSTPAIQLACARTLGDKYRVAPADMFSHGSRRPDGKIRIGYLSADYHEHPTSYLIAELIERHDRRRFEVSGYSIGPDSTGIMRRRLTAGFDRFVDLRLAPFREAAERLHRDGIDILVDLKGYTQDAKTRILAFRPAPLQVNFLGYPGSMGAGFIDYIIADRFCIPSVDDMFYSEKVVRLPDCYQPNDSRRTIAERTPSRAEAGLPKRGFVFCCFNNTYKLTPPFFDVWMRLLAAVPDSVLWLLENNDGAEVNLRHEAALRGVDADRLVFAPRLPLPHHLARHRLADLFLDTLPYNAHTTASDALWAGLPVLTCAGQTFAGRVAASLLNAIGLPELITETIAEYESLALKLASEPAGLAVIREKLLKNRGIAPLFDIERYTCNIEGAYTWMWSRWCDGQPAASFDVTRIASTAP